LSGAGTLLPRYQNTENIIFLVHFYKLILFSINLTQVLGCKYIYDYFKDRERERKKTRTSQLCKEERDGNKDGTIK
jgi:hypothetical protein